MSMYQSKTKTIYRMSFEEVEVRPDGTETVVRRIMDQMHGEDDPSEDIGCLIGLIINSICNCDEPSAEPIFVAAIRRVHNPSRTFSDLADAYRDWKGEEDFEDFVEVRRLKDGAPNTELESQRATVAKLRDKGKLMDPAQNLQDAINEYRQHAASFETEKAVEAKERFARLAYEQLPELLLIHRTLRKKARDWELICERNEERLRELEAHCEEYERAFHQIMTMAGNPDPSEACRLIIKRAKEALNDE